jgi:hypothetical protein
MARLCGQKFLIMDAAIEGLASRDPLVVHESFRVARLILDTEHDVSPGGRPAHLEPDFEEGSAIHAYQQFRHGERGYLWGRWRCAHCSVMTEPGFMPRVTTRDKQGKPLQVAAPCPACRGQNYLYQYRQIRWFYEEPYVGLPEWTLAGHADGIYLVPRDGYIIPAILEIKSINENGFMGKYGEPLPKKDHIAQGSQYVFAARQHFPWLREIRHIYFVYVNKNAPRETKEFLVEADMGVVGNLQQTMAGVLAVKRKETPQINLRICASNEAVGATQCPVCFECWGKRPPASIFDSKLAFKPGELPL